MFKYTLGFIKRKDEILLVNREKKPWKGSWNGVGGKISENETPLACIIREVFEETNIKIDQNQVIDKGYLTWNLFDANGNGLHLYLILADDNFLYQTPVRTLEGILDWKKVDWIIDQDNYGVAHNIIHFLDLLIHDEKRYHYHCHFEGRNLVRFEKELI
jgi:8-oxo-dGTP diphosphatase